MRLIASCLALVGPLFLAYGASAAELVGRVVSVTDGDTMVVLVAKNQISPLYAVQAEARAARRGLWRDTNPVPPWEWRRKR